MKLVLSLGMIVVPVILACCASGCASSQSLQLSTNSLVYSSQPAKDYAYAGPYQFHSGSNAK